jgi:hypothetical protein
LAKEWGQSTKDVLAVAERLGMQGQALAEPVHGRGGCAREGPRLVPRGDGLAIGKERVSPSVW